ncbi:MAG: biotin--[acetyl-CoA-carboxylase] ligase [Bacteroidota bacterium]|nr:biotin--[acetyl-CoA-carboxylase] ligase [Bacteroidota bacterium]MDP4205874.1 biotin--[acetyl-CoA-carboxylase] ligase [Bacteroidota bacterium]
MKYIGFPIIMLGSIDSTNNYANRQIAEHEVVEGTVFLAEYQTTGKGQQYNSWESERGKNLTFSLVLYPDFVEIMKQFMISKVVTLGISDFLIKNGIKEVAIKWPNDIYVGDKKIAGILIENTIQGPVLAASVIGIGLNVNQEIFISPAPNPVSMKMLTGLAYDLEESLDQLLKSIMNWYNVLQSNGQKVIDEAFESRMYRYGTWSGYHCETGYFEGKILGVDEIGRLLIEDRDEKLRTFHFKEVAFIQPKKTELPGE